jgi:hypothetical protein
VRLRQPPQPSDRVGGQRIPPPPPMPPGGVGDPFNGETLGIPNGLLIPSMPGVSDLLGGADQAVPPSPIVGLLAPILAAFETEGTPQNAACAKNANKDFFSCFIAATAVVGVSGDICLISCSSLGSPAAIAACVVLCKECLTNLKRRR